MSEAATVVPWVEFGLAGLFGVFALTLTKFFLSHLDKADARWSVRLEHFDETIQGLTEAVSSLNNRSR